MSSNDSPETFPYIIQADDTIWDLAEEYDTTIEDIMDVNPEVDPENLYIGQIINVPGDPPSAWVYEEQNQPFRRPEFDRRRRPRRPPFRPFFRPACPGGRFYTIQPGDNLFRISRRFGVPVGELIAANRHVNFNFLQPGEIICISFRRF
jgi:LysM repeat protein